jgi:GAF domain-containing protein/HAMP domain-containing protein
MNEFAPTPISVYWLIAADLLAMVSLILALYVLVLNPKHRTNQVVSVALIVLDVNILCVGLLLRASIYAEARVPFAILVSLGPAINPALMIATLQIFKPAWLKRGKSWLLMGLIGLALLPALLTVIDIVLGTRLYYTAPDPMTYTGGYLGYEVIARGLIGQPVIYVVLIGMGMALLLPLFYFSFLDRGLGKRERWLAAMLLGVQVVAIVLNIVLSQRLLSGISVLLVSAIYNVAYGYAAFQQMISERRSQKGRLQTRLTALMLVISIPAFIFIAYSLTKLSEDYLRNYAIKGLQDGDVLLSSNTTTWLQDNVTALRTLAWQPAIVSMDALQQKPILQVMAANYPYMYLVSTIDTHGMNVARSDEAALTDYSDRYWFQNAMAGAPVSYQTLIGRTTGLPALVVSVPIYGQDGSILGVCMFASQLTKISEQVEAFNIGETGFAYVVDDKNQLVASPILGSEAAAGTVQEAALIDYSDQPPVVAMRSGLAAPFSYEDNNGIAWRAYYTQLDIGWGIIVQQQEVELTAPYHRLGYLAVGLIGLGSLILFALVWATMRQAVQPINSLTQTVQAVTAGNLDRMAPVESEDEIGTLALAFNSMTSQVRGLIGSLERRVAERTLDLEHRSAQLQAAAEVGRAAATMRNLDELLPLVSRLISERFGFYHVGIFLIDANRQYAVLRASNSAGGQRMLARGHKLRVGQQGIVGYVTSRVEPRIALNVGEDAVYFNNPDLPETQSEMALPLSVGDELMGALDVQSIQPNAFTEQDVATMQVLADQVAIAINGARLLQQTEQLLEAERRAYGEIGSHTWAEYVQSLPTLGFERSRDRGLIEVKEIKDQATRKILTTGQMAFDQEDPAILYMPVKLRDQVIGVLKVRARTEEVGSGKSGDGAGIAASPMWDDANIRTIEAIAEQLGSALESARAYQQTQHTAQRERLLGNISGRVRETLDIEAILKTASQEVRQALGLSKVVVRLGAPPERIGESTHSTSGAAHGAEPGGDGGSDE